MCCSKELFSSVSSAAPKQIRSYLFNLLSIDSRALDDSNIFMLTCFSGENLQIAYKPVLSLTHLDPLTKVDVVVSSTFTVHLVDKEAGHRFYEQVEDGHSNTEAKYIPSSFSQQVTEGVIDPKMDDVGQYGHHHPHKELQGKSKK